MGEPVAEIVKIARHENIGIVFVSTRREDIEKRFYTGTVARRLSLTLLLCRARARCAFQGGCIRREYWSLSRQG